MTQLETIQSIINDLNNEGIKLLINDNQLAIRVPKTKKVNSQLLQSLKENRSDILFYLKWKSGKSLLNV
ncbi:hypothetical protein JMN32_10560 [Fulvivirga sp. 29W222]|uniref:TubC N-terminal docking domain-containing protein n=1 Tax=Fulvivirga marina TaxID=2494733 RepID=A0A937FV78_9BACT|nr:hypothetical protein [Fulvivirga marina]